MQQDLIAKAQGLVQAYIIPLGWKLLGALAVWIVGAWIIKLLRAGLGRAMTARQVDKTLQSYMDASANVLMRILVLIAVFGVMGIETTSFAALIAAIGIAIGAAWAGLLSNFAAGIFLMVLRPFKVGDMINGGGVTGDVKELGLFVTAIDTVDNIRVYVGNSKLFSDVIQNYTTNAYRRVDLKAQLHHSVDPKAAIQKLKEQVAKVPNVLPTPAPSVEILEFNAMGCLVAVRPFCHNNDYWQVYFDTNKAILEAGAAAGWPAPETRHLLRKEG
jgi:small conductance mechanosensitive channel